MMEHISDLSLDFEVHFLITEIESPSIKILFSFISNPIFTASKHACASAAKAKSTFSYMVALEAITLPLLFLATIPELALKNPD
ncbi:hypothetical protein F383_19443 [Gossypium arboreum]|uniref:Uncharacterized protein n=1 Tax=Gossypium arboreum TaxID=29729 RepID=A0A0B0MM68_GOSAR|nr:hypothetical protein F383_19443 [Gossypium arboreum]